MVDVVQPTSNASIYDYSLKFSSGLKLGGMEDSTIGVEGLVASKGTSYLTLYSVGSWQALPSLEEGRGYLAASFALDGSLYVAGGCGQDGDAVDTLEAFDVRAGRWRACADLPGPRACFAMAQMV